MKNVVWVVLILLMLSVWTWIQMPDGKLRVIFCDVGQGDGALVTLGYFQALIDTGEDEGAILECLSRHIPFWDRRLEVVFLTHPDSDHTGAMSGVERGYEIERVIRKAGQGDAVRFGNLHFDILSRSFEECEKDNQCSLVIRVGYLKFSGLFTGDIGETEELALIGQGVIGKSDVLKVAHHGSKFSSTKEFLEAVSPKLAVISVGAKNRYGHPTSDTLMRLDAVGARIVRTDQLGTIEVISDGNQVWTVKK